MNELRERVDATPMPDLEQSLLDAKNAQIDELTSQIATLKSRDAMAKLIDEKQAEVERLTSQLHTLRSRDEMAQEIQRLVSLFVYCLHFLFVYFVALRARVRVTSCIVNFADVCVYKF